MLPDFAYLRAKSQKEALSHLQEPDAYVFAGGTDLQGCLRDRVFPVQKVVSIQALRDLRGIRETANGGVRIGALTTITEIASHPLIRDRYPGLAIAAGEVASPQLRNQGTIGGNLCQRPRCWYFRGDFRCLKKGGDMCFAESGENRYHAIMGGTPCYIVHPSDTAPMLLALNAVLHIAGPAGQRTVPADRFFVLPEDDIMRENVLAHGELLTEVHLPPPAEDSRSIFRKVRERGSWDFALASVSVVLEMAGDRVAHARIVLGGVAPIPWPLPEVEARLEGNAIEPELVEEVAHASTLDAEPLEQNAYKVNLVQAVVRESLLALA